MTQEEAERALEELAATYGTPDEPSNVLVARRVSDNPKIGNSLAAMRTQGC